MATSKIKGSSILVTGANGGMAIPIVQQLLERGADRIVLACRTQEKAEEAKQKITQDAAQLEKLHCQGGFDMCDQAAIATAVQALPEDLKLDIVFLQAGGMVVANEWQFVTTGDTKIERTLYQNCVGAYATLYELEKRGLIATEKARIVFAGGEGARGLPPLMKKPTFASSEEWRNYIAQGGGGKYDCRQALAESKFASALLVQTLAATAKAERSYVWFSPGMTGGTNGMKDIPNPKKFIMENIGFPMMTLLGKANTPEKAALKFVDCLDAKPSYGANGEILGAPEGKGLGPIVDQKPMNACFTDKALQEELWGIVKRVVGDINAVSAK